MKKIFVLPILFTFLFINQFLSQTFPFVKGVSPSPILKGIEFACDFSSDNTWSDSIPELDGIGIFIQDTLELVYDGSHTGNNPAYSDPHLLANEGCLDANGQPYIQSSLNGKIAVLYRGTCEFGMKTWLAENNGAEAVLLINHTANDFAPGMAGGDSGTVVNIPIVSLSYEDGNYLLKQMEKGPVVVRIGNDRSNLSYDIMTKKSRCLGPPLRTMPYKSFHEYIKDMHAYELISITNTGSQDLDFKYWNILEYQSSVIAHSFWNGDNVPNNDYTISYGTDIDSIMLPDPGSIQQLPQGPHTLTTFLESNFDEDTTNNKASFPLFFNNVVSLASTDSSNGEIIANFYPSEHDSSYISCMYLDPSLTSQIGANPEGVYFSISKDDGLVGGEQIELEIYPDLSSSSIFNDTYTCPSDTLNKKIIYHPITLQSIDGYICLKTESPSVKFGYESVPNYLSDYVYDIDEQQFLLGDGMNRRFNPVQIDGVWDEFYGWGRVKALSLGIKYGSPQNIAENKAIKTELFPNPTKDIVTISVADFSGNIFTEVYDIVGNKLQSTSETTISLGDYANGIYLLKVAYGNRVEEIKVVKD